MPEAELLCAENIGLKDITQSRRGELISRGELIMYYRSCDFFSKPCLVRRLHLRYVTRVMMSSI